MESSELIIPVYLNQRVVFDLIAMLRGGISTVTRISSSEENKEVDNRRYGSAFGLSQAFSSLLKIDVSGDRLKASEEKAGTQKSEERVHTPASLFQQLRSTLKTEKKIIVIDSTYVPSSGQIIEFSASLRRNPMIQTMNIFTELVDMAVAFGDEEKADSSKNSGKNRNRRDSPNNSEKGRKRVQKILELLKTGDTIDILSDNLDCGYKAVITLEEEYLNDPTMADLVDGQFKVVGKITRAISDSEDSVSLLRKAAIGVMSNEVLSEEFSRWSSLAASIKVKIPRIEWEVQGPAIQVIPIAIFA